MCSDNNKLLFEIWLKSPGKGITSVDKPLKYFWRVRLEVFIYPVVIPDWWDLSERLLIKVILQ